MLWLCVAHEKEIPGFASFSKAGFQTHALGVGQFKSLAQFSALVAQNKPARVVLAGSCGSLDRNEVLKVFACQHFAYPSIAHEELPEFMAHCGETRRALPPMNLPAATVLQNHGLSLSAEKFARDLGYIPTSYPRPIVENMEAASLALFCRDNGIDFTAVLCVTNVIGPDARAEWKANFREAGNRLRRALESLP
ncbi:purine or other phosphorylase family 1 [Turneriella parva]|uniref:Purine or other phosphorylase family 1 n=1 Tax=Turneriella parva (strain ATCC BAA-1111 / DSM 21527 / NCTC 11395 / H) TaxID=869212 RepID=I4B5Q2_TURPD|nr:purine or other phosphorylase family 1 [Turneriella parva]AFM12609.1 purine or other phosphorylase family 1 [Turneriella parva DSM 21527]